MQSHDTSNETLPNCPPSPSGPCASLFAKPTFYHLPYNNIFILSVQAVRAKHRHHPESKVLVLVVNITNILLTPAPCYYCGVIPNAWGGAKQSLTNPSPKQDDDWRGCWIRAGWSLQTLPSSSHVSVASQHR